VTFVTSLVEQPPEGPACVELPLDAKEIRIGVFLDRRLPRLITPQERLQFLSAVWRATLAGTPGLTRQLGGLTADPEQFDLQAVSIRQTYFPTAGAAAAEVWMRGVVAAVHQPFCREFVWTGPVRLAAAGGTYDVRVVALVFGT
jgi:hypothetical protein